MPARILLPGRRRLPDRLPPHQVLRGRAPHARRLPGASAAHRARASRHVCEQRGCAPLSSRRAALRCGQLQLAVHSASRTHHDRSGSSTESGAAVACGRPAHSHRPAPNVPGRRARGRAIHTSGCIRADAPKYVASGASDVRCAAQAWRRETRTRGRARQRRAARRRGGLRDGGAAAASLGNGGGGGARVRGGTSAGGGTPSRVLTGGCGGCGCGGGCGAAAAAARRRPPL